MQERFLHRVWQLGLFNRTKLQTTAGEPLEVVHPGFPNTDAGPDFRQAKLKIGLLDWHGDVEIHHRSQQWNQHGHHTDAAYNRVVLHVVGEGEAQTVYRADGTAIPTLNLQGRIWPEAFARYARLLESLEAIPCEPLLPRVDSLNRQAMLQRALLERLQRKAEAVEKLLVKNQADWEETAWQWLVSQLGFKTNADAFAELAVRLPWKVLIRLGTNSLQREALLFGLSGLLPGAPESGWVGELQREWKFLQHKHQLQEKVLSPLLWKMSRLRPANFPTLRLAQLTAFSQRSEHLFRLLLETESAVELLAHFQAEPSAFWKTHYHFGKTSSRAQHRMGRSSAEVLLINAVAPLRVAFGRMTAQEQYAESALELLQQLPAEENRLLRRARTAGLSVKSAADSQAAIELLNQYCTEKRCLDCSIGLKILQGAYTS